MLAYTKIPKLTKHKKVSFAGLLHINCGAKLTDRVVAIFLDNLQSPVRLYWNIDITRAKK